MRNFTSFRFFSVLALTSNIFALNVVADDSVPMPQSFIPPPCSFAPPQEPQVTVPAERAIAACHGVHALTGEAAVVFYTDDRVLSLLTELLTEENQGQLLQVVDNSQQTSATTCDLVSSPNWRYDYNEWDIDKAAATCATIRGLTGISRSLFYSDVRLLIAFTDALYD